MMLWYAGISIISFLLNYHFHSTNCLLQFLFQSLQNLAVQDYADLYLHCGEMLLEAEQAKNALGYFLPLMELSDVDRQRLLLKIGKCHELNEDLDSALDVYRNAFEMDERNVEACLAFCAVLRKAQQLDLAMDVIETCMSQLDTPDAKLLSAKANLHLLSGEFDEFVSSVTPMLEDQAKRNSQKKVRQRSSGSGRSRRVSGDDPSNNLFRYAALPHSGGKRRAKDSPKASSSSEPDTIVYGHLIKLSVGCIQNKRYADGNKKLLDILNGTSKVVPELYRYQVKLLHSALALGCNDYSTCYSSLRVISVKYPTCKYLWDMFTQIVPNLVPVKLTKFLTRILANDKSNVFALVMMGHHYHTVGSRNEALCHYFQVYQKYPENPFINLFIGKCLNMF
jgi:tetratricopeptide (TPR) repeat protein